jgi:hypothetical protein
MLRGVFMGMCVAGALSACSSGGGGDGGQGGDGPNPGDIVGGGADPSLAFSYPVNGQDDVYTRSQIVAAYRGDLSGDPGLTLAIDGTPIETDVERDSDQSRIFRLRVADDSGTVERAGLQPNTDYSVENADGDTLFSFTTRGPGGNADNFAVAPRTTIGDRRVPLTAFNPVRAGFTQPVDEGSVELCAANENLGTDCTVSITGPDGAVPGRLTILGTSMTFDPSSDLGDGTPNSRDARDYDTSDLVGGQTYTVAFAGVQSAYGDTLNTSFDVTPVAISEGDSVDTVQTLSVTSQDGDNALNGGTRNVARIASQLIGENIQTARNTPERGGLLTRLAGTTAGGRYNNTFPALLPAGQQFELDGIDLQLGGAIDTPVNTGPIQARLINDGDIYIAGNAPLAGLEQPTLVLLRLDLGISTQVSEGDAIEALSNGVFNQTVMNVVAAGQAIPQPNGDIKLAVLGSFPVAVNRTGTATTDFELELTLPNPKAGGSVTVENDQTAPRIIAQYPSACLYTFNTRDASGDPLFESGDVVGGVSGTTTLSDTEANCIDVLNQRNIISANDTGDPQATFNFPDPRANSLPLNASPSITFSEPIDPTSLASNITLSNVATGNTVPARLHSEGSSVVIDPIDRLRADTQYSVTVGQGITDLAGNGLTGSFPGSTIVSDITFNTERMVVPTDNEGTPTTIDRGEREAVRQTAPFLTALTPGLPCALMTSSDEPQSDFRSGGNTAGRCVGDDPDIGDQYPAPNDPDVIASGAVPPSLQVPGPTSVNVVYPVFSQPANVSVDGYFSKPVKADTIKLANGCLVGGSGNTNSDATIAVQTMDGNGNCTGVVPGSVATLTPGSSLTRGFSFKPEAGFVSGRRYWIVLCGSKNALDAQRNPELDQSHNPDSQCSTGKTIIGQSGLALNTNPLDSSGSAVSAIATGAPGSSGFVDCQGRAPNSSAACFDDYRGGGGPDILMPFTGAPATANYMTTMLALPETDTNGNGYFDNTAAGDFFTSYASNNGQGNRSGYVIQGVNTGEDRGVISTDFNPLGSNSPPLAAHSVNRRHKASV